MSPPEAEPPKKRVVLRWSGDGDVYFADAASFQATIDGDGEQGPSPMDALLLAVSGCMAIDVRMILEKSRVPLESLSVEASGERAEEPPRRFRTLVLTYRLRGPAAEDLPKVQRAVQLSRDKYCSVLHTLRPDLDVTVEIALP